MHHNHCEQWNDHFHVYNPLPWGEKIPLNIYTLAGLSQDWAGVKVLFYVSFCRPIVFGGRGRLGGRFGYFLFFSDRGRGRGVRGARKGVRGVGFSLKIPGGGVCRERGGGGGGRRGAGSLQGMGGGAKYFFSGPKFPPRKAHNEIASNSGTLLTCLLSSFLFSLCDSLGPDSSGTTWLDLTRPPPNHEMVKSRRAPDYSSNLCPPKI